MKGNGNNDFYYFLYQVASKFTSIAYMHEDIKYQNDLKKCFTFFSKIEAIQSEGKLRKVHDFSLWRLRSIGRVWLVYVCTALR